MSSLKGCAATLQLFRMPLCFENATSSFFVFTADSFTCSALAACISSHLVSLEIWENFLHGAILFSLFSLCEELLDNIEAYDGMTQVSLQALEWSVLLGHFPRLARKSFQSIPSTSFQFCLQQSISNHQVSQGSLKHPSALWLVSVSLSIWQWLSTPENLCPIELVVGGQSGNIQQDTACRLARWLCGGGQLKLGGQSVSIFPFTGKPFTGTWQVNAFSLIHDLFLTGKYIMVET